MKALILNSGNKGDVYIEALQGFIMQELEVNGFEVNTLLVEDLNLLSCRGCFSCWFKSPGICINQDDTPILMKEIVKADLLVALTPISFGGYSSRFKKALDRFILMALPDLMLVKGETHHPIRYDSIFDILGVGILNEFDEDLANLFGDLIERNARNGGCSVYGSQVVIRGREMGDIKGQFSNLLREMGYAANE